MLKVLEVEQVHFNLLDYIKDQFYHFMRIISRAITGSGMGRDNKSQPFRNGMFSIYLNPSNM